MLVKLIATGMATTTALLAFGQHVPIATSDSNSIGLSVLGAGSALLAWLLSRQIKQLDEALHGFRETDERHESRLNNHGKDIAVLKVFLKLPPPPPAELE